LSRCDSIMASNSNLHNDCRHLNSSILFLKLRMLKWATLTFLPESIHI
jgi:hypothetical protein